MSDQSQDQYEEEAPGSPESAGSPGSVDSSEPTGSPESESNGDPIDPQEQVESLMPVDPDTVFARKIDKRFVQGEEMARAHLPPPEQLWNVREKLGIPQIDIDANPNTKAVLQFIYRLNAYRPEAGGAAMPILMQAFQGPTGASWCCSAGYDFDKTINMLLNLLNWMVRREDWFQLKTQVERGIPLSDNLNTHIFFFKRVAMYMGLEVEGEDTKRLFIRSLKYLPMALAKNPDGSFKSFAGIIQMALEDKDKFHGSQKESAPPSEQGGEDPTAAMAMKRPRYGNGENNNPGKYRNVKGKKSRNSVVCYNCGKRGHIASQCRAPKNKKKESNESEDKQSESKKKKKDSKKACTAVEKKEEEYWSSDESDEE